MHGQYIRNMDRQCISEEYMFVWLSRGDLKGQTETEIIAAKDQTLQTKYHATKILQTDSKCRPSKQFDETVEYIISACAIFPKEQYINRYDCVCSTTL